MAKPTIEDLVLGKGPEAVRDKTVEVHYTGWLTDGKQFDSSVGGDAFSFRLGKGEVIEGWDRGVAGMKKTAVSTAGATLVTQSGRPQRGPQQFRHAHRRNAYPRGGAAGPVHSQAVDPQQHRLLDPNVWFNNVELIAAEKIGRQTVQYVSNIYKYYLAYRMVVEGQGEREKAKEDIKKEMGK